jgi:hypothetical protein
MGRVVLCMYVKSLQAWVNRVNTRLLSSESVSRAAQRPSPRAAFWQPSNRDAISAGRVTKGQHFVSWSDAKNDTSWSALGAAPRSPGGKNVALGEGPCVAAQAGSFDKDRTCHDLAEIVMNEPTCGCLYNRHRMSLVPTNSI